MLSKALTVNFAHISAVGHAAAVSCRLDRWSVKAGPCYLTLGWVNDDHGGFDVVGKAGSSLFNLHTSSRKVRFVRAGLFCFRCSGFMSTCELRERERFGWALLVHGEFMSQADIRTTVFTVLVLYQQYVLPNFVTYSFR